MVMIMGRIKAVLIKTLGNEVLKRHRDKFGGEFDKNKKALLNLIDIKSKKIRNVLAGYITREMRSSKKMHVKKGGAVNANRRFGGRGFKNQ